MSAQKAGHIHMRKSISILLMLVVTFTATLANAAKPTEAEALFVRRIVELWKGGDYDLAKQQMRQFLGEYPDSPFRDRLMAVAGDHEWSQAHYAEAARFYERIASEDLNKASLDRRVDCLYRIGEYADILTILADNLPPDTGTELTDPEALRLFFYGEALTHRADEEEDEDVAIESRETALKHFQRLDDTTVAPQAKLSAANTLVKLGRAKDSIALYLALADEFPDNHEALVLRAAQLQTQYDPEGALQTLARLQGHRSESGAFSQIFLLFNAGRYQELVDKRTQLLTSISAEQQPLFDFFLGRAAFAVGKYQEATDWLKPLLDRNTVVSSSPSNEKAILITLIASAQQLDNGEEAAGWMTRYEQEFPKDTTINRLQLAQALLHRGKGKPIEALAIIERIAGKLPSEEDSEKAAFQHITLLYDLGRLRESYQKAEEFVATYPNSDLGPSLKKLMIQATAKQLQDTTLSSEARIALQQRISKEIGAALRIKGVLTSDEKATYLLQLAKSEYAQKHFHGAMVAATQFIDDYPRDHDAYQAHLILAYCHLENGTSLPSFIENAEAALRLEPNMPDQDVIHLNLVGAYLKLAQASGENSNEEGGNTSRAAEHAYTVVSRGISPVKLETLRWLAHYYYVQVRAGGNETLIQPLPLSNRRVLAHRAAQVLQTALAKSSSTEPERLQEYIMLSRLYGWLGLEDQRRELLEQTVARPWPDSREIRQQLNHLRLELGQRYEITGDHKKALAVYEQLVSGAAENDPYVRDATQLQMSRLRFYALPEAQRRADNPEVVMVLSTLQGLQTRRSISQEPVHLEAAWSRAWISASLEGPFTHDDRLLNNLKQAKRDIVSQDDIVSRDYHASRQKRPDKDTIYQAYLMLFDARIAQLEAQQAASRLRYQEQKSKLLAAETLYNTLLHGNFAVSNYLVLQAQSGLDEIAATREL
jgi:TolA-binding protein